MADLSPAEHAAATAITRAQHHKLQKSWGYDLGDECGHTTLPIVVDAARAAVAAVEPIIRAQVAEMIGDELDKAALFWRARIDDSPGAFPGAASSVARSIAYADAGAIAREAGKLARRHIEKSDVKGA